MCSIIMSLCRHKKKWKDWVPLNLVVRMLTASLTDSCVRGTLLDHAVADPDAVIRCRPWNRAARSPMHY